MSHHRQKNDWQKMLSIPAPPSKRTTAQPSTSGRVLTGSEYLQTLKEKEEKKKEEALWKEERKLARAEKARERAAMQERKAREREERKAQKVIEKASTRPGRPRRKGARCVEYFEVNSDESLIDSDDSSTAFHPSSVDLGQPGTSSQLSSTLPSPDYTFGSTRVTPTPSEVAYCLESFTTDVLDHQEESLDDETPGMEMYNSPNEHKRGMLQ